jgi:3D (Asp-Asp-Asp) domain-containing protein
MKYKNNMHIGISAVTVAAMLMNGSVHRVPKVESKPKTEEINFVKTDYQLEDQQILHMKNEVRKQEYIRKQREEELRLKEQRLKEQERKRQEQIAREKEQNKQIYYEVTAYTAGYESTQKHKGDVGYGITASGAPVKEGRTIACPPSLKFGTRVNIEGIGIRVCEDRGGAIKQGHLDLYMSNLNDALNFGRKRLLVEILK